MDVKISLRAGKVVDGAASLSERKEEVSARQTRTITLGPEGEKWRDATGESVG